MIVLLHRGRFSKVCTPGTLFVRRATFATMEYPPESSPHATKARLPDGQYELELVDDDHPLNLVYRRRFGEDMHHGMLHLVGTNAFIAMGNLTQDIGGNILVGMAGSDDILSETQLAYETLYPVLRDDIESGAQVMIDLES